MAITPEQLLEDIIKAQTDYGKIIRKTLSLSRYRMALDQGVLKADDYFNEIVRESDLEHIGHLPMLATIVHPHLENKDNVDLAKSLLYLSLHEAPERLVGDVLHEDKDQKYNDAELEAARKVYSGPYSHYFPLYEDFHFVKNIDAQFAYSMDRLAPFVYYEIQHPDTRIPRWKELGLTTDKIRKYTKKYMSWDKTLENLFDYLVAEIEKQDQEFLKQ